MTRAIFKTCTTCRVSTEANPGLAQVMACQCIFLPVAPIQRVDTEDLWNCDPNCAHDEKCQPGGGVKCTKCGGWFCY